MNLSAYIDRLESLTGVVNRIERRGVPIDLEVCADIMGKANADANETARWLDGYLAAHSLKYRPPWDHNWNYAQWLIEVLHGDLKIPPSPFQSKGRVDLAAGERSTDGRALEYMAATCPEHREFLNQIRQFRRQARMANYAETWIKLAVKHKDGTYRLHPGFGLAFDTDDRPGAKTGRFGLKNPALQQVPRDKRKDPYRLRRAFVAPPGKILIVADYSQLEVVILAHLCAVLFDDHGLADRLQPGMPDLHSATAKFVFGEVLRNPEMAKAAVESIKTDPSLGRFRDLIKAIRYGLNYCKGAWGFGNTLFEVDEHGEISGPPLGEEKAQEMIDALYAFDPGIQAFQNWTEDYITRTGMMPSLLGRWCPFPGASSGDKWARKRAWRQACNWPMQAGGQEITAAAMIALDALGAEMTLQVHDELHVLADEGQADKVAAQVKECMEQAVELQAPLSAKPSIAANWEAAK